MSLDALHEITEEKAYPFILGVLRFVISCLSFCLSASYGALLVKHNFDLSALTPFLSIATFILGVTLFIIIFGAVCLSWGVETWRTRQSRLLTQKGNQYE